MESKTVVLKQFVDEGEVGPEHFDIVTSTVDTSTESRDMICTRHQLW